MLKECTLGLFALHIDMYNRCVRKATAVETRSVDYLLSMCHTASPPTKTEDPDDIGDMEMLQMLAALDGSDDEAEKHNIKCSLLMRVTLRTAMFMC